MLLLTLCISSYDHIVPKPDSPPRRKKLRAHIFERRRTKASRADKIPKMSLREALARLSGRDFVPIKKNFWTRVAELERMLRSPDSIYAFKTAAAVAVFAVFLLAPSLHVRPRLHSSDRRLTENFHRRSSSTMA